MAKKLPNKIIIIPSKEKKWHEKWFNGRDLLNIPYPYRMLICSVPNSGKTNLVKNILLRANPPFKNIYLYHYDIDCEEYEDIDCVKLKELPTSKDERFNQKDKSLLIIEDTKIKKKEIDNLDRLFGYTSTHRGLSIILISQTFFTLPTNIRRMVNVFCLWRNSADFNSLYIIGKKFALTKEEFMNLISKCKSNFDFIMLDKSNNSPAKIRLNGYEILHDFDNKI